ncbi:DNA polymerase III subunit delta [Simiduia agarivorans]|uniref:DNA polymerase III subunit delta n=1 Tax=Simiduia agarivorans (strain DSM 21679 / JCM 13881 / BCRC 17597 / SA1) TaxID=1117647 RepID=K4L307_SIMAS|nr:DNA polymerase III subunit delta [Simiduia agarivorans]AFV00583.1 DNA polymerase III subunit delta [Simiduia agarivorans SA1 = DSM 21679]
MAKLRAEQLAAAASKSLAPIYIISGDEPLLVQEACDTLRQSARQQGYTERERYHADKSFDWGQLHASAASLSLFAEKKIIELHITGGKPGTEGGKALQEYAARPADDNLLLIVLPKIDRNTQKAKWFSALEQAGVFIQIWPINGAQLHQWLDQRLSAAGLSADRSAIDMLATRIEGNLLAAAQEIEKLKLLATDGRVDSQLLANVVANSARYDIFGLVDKALLGDVQAAVRNLQGLKGEGTEPLAILWALTRDIRSLLQVAAGTASGSNFDWACKQAGVWDSKKSIVSAALRRLKPNELEVLLRKCNGIDRAVKGMRPADPWDELLDLVLQLAGVRSLTASNTRMSLSI